MVQMAPAVAPISGALVANHLRPYEQWPTFRELIERARAGFASALGDHAIERLGLRYINELPLDPSRRIRDVLVARPQLPEPLAGSVVNIYQRADIPMHDIEGIFIHQAGLGAPRGDGPRALFLDLDLGSTKPFQISDSEAILAWLDRAHDRISEAFAASVTKEYFAELKRGSA
jgi:uncharacterized protein (TIGR04255 family)